MSPGRALYGVILLALVGVLGWRVIASDATYNAPLFEGTAAQHLSRIPLGGDAFSDVAVAAQESGDPEAGLALNLIAARRDPRDLRIRVWLADHYLRAGQYPQALAQMDVMLRLSPEIRQTLPPLMAQWTGDPAFARALATTLREQPVWRSAMMAALRKDIASPGVAMVFAALRSSGDLDDAETTRWLDALMQAGHWGVAYSYWVSGLELAPGTPLPMLYNGDFEQRPSQQGFDWRVGGRAGTYTEFEAARGASGKTAHLVFLGRPVDFANLEQALVLPPGHYRLSMRAKAVALRSDQGLHWTLTCHGQSTPLATSPPLEGSFDWRRVSMAFDIPATDCQGQWLRLANPAPGGSARTVSGELWFDDLGVKRGQVQP